MIKYANFEHFTLMPCGMAHMYQWMNKDEFPMTSIIIYAPYHKHSVVFKGLISHDTLTYKKVDLTNEEQQEMCKLLGEVPTTLDFMEFTDYAELTTIPPTIYKEVEVFEVNWEEKLKWKKLRHLDS